MVAALVASVPEHSSAQMSPAARELRSAPDGGYEVTERAAWLVPYAHSRWPRYVVVHAPFGACCPDPQRWLLARGVGHYPRGDLVAPVARIRARAAAGG